LRAAGEAAGLIAARPTLLNRVLDETRKAGYGHRYAPGAGHYNYAQHEYDDGRDSIAVPVIVGRDVVATINLTWFRAAATAGEIVAAHLASLQDAAAEIARELAG
jgi:IclR family transcriptional regulator, mhp operon transcriptional activator